MTKQRQRKPNYNTFIIEADGVPVGKANSWIPSWANLQLGTQCTMCKQFSGGNKTYDGLGRNAGNNNTLFLFAWLAF